MAQSNEPDPPKRDEDEPGAEPAKGQREGAEGPEAADPGPDQPDRDADAVSEAQALSTKDDDASEPEAETAMEPAADAEPEPDAGEADDRAGEERLSSVDAVPEAEIAQDRPEAVPEADAAQDRPEAAKSVTTPPPPPAREVAVERVGFVPMALGGAVAAALGLAAGWTIWAGEPEFDTTEIDSQRARIEEIVARLDGLPPSPEPQEIADLVTPALDAVSTRVDEIDGRIEALDDSIAALDERIGAVERAPNEDGTLSQEALAAWETELRDLRDEIASQADEIQQVSDETQAALDARTEAAAAAEAAALRAAEVAAARAALAELEAALETGAPYEEPLSRLQDNPEVAPPDALVAAAEAGVPTLAELQADFPETARQALSTARASGASAEEGGRVVSFLRSTLNARSVTPQDGTSADAILSRAEAALAAGQLDEALAEVEMLPEGVRDAMAGWVESARARQSAVAAARDIDQSLTE